MDLKTRRELNNGFGDSLSRSFEFAATPALFAGVGYLVDRIFDTQPVFMIVLLLWASVSQVLLWWYRYDAEMKKIEAELLEKRDSGQKVPSDASTTSGASTNNAGATFVNRASNAAAAASGVTVFDGRLPSGITLDTDLSDLLASFDDADVPEHWTSQQPGADS